MGYKLSTETKCSALSSKLEAGLAGFTFKDSGNTVVYTAAASEKVVAIENDTTGEFFPITEGEGIKVFGTYGTRLTLAGDYAWMNDPCVNYTVTLINSETIKDGSTVVKSAGAYTQFIYNGELFPITAGEGKILFGIYGTRLTINSTRDSKLIWKVAQSGVLPPIPVRNVGCRIPWDDRGASSPKDRPFGLFEHTTP